MSCKPLLQTPHLPNTPGVSLKPSLTHSCLPPPSSVTSSVALVKGILTMWGKLPNQLGLGRIFHHKAAGVVLVSIFQGKPCWAQVPILNPHPEGAATVLEPLGLRQHILTHKLLHFRLAGLATSGAEFPQVAHFAKGVARGRSNKTSHKVRKTQQSRFNAVAPHPAWSVVADISGSFTPALLPA